VLQVTRLMIAAELAQGRLVQLKQNLAQLLGFSITGRETLPVNLTQCADDRESRVILKEMAAEWLKLAEAPVDSAPPADGPLPDSRRLLVRLDREPSRMGNRRFLQAVRRRPIADQALGKFSSTPTPSGS
jgi:hypothetical protein